jgi:trk system potassium uptake protein TrkA
MRIVIFGAGRVGRTLLRILESKKHKVTIIDQQREVCDEAASETNANVICGDVTDPELLGRLKLSEMDYVFAVTGSEETNFLVSVYAKQVNSRRVISRASETKYSQLMEKLGVEPLIPELTLARELANMVLSPLISTMLDPRDSKIEMVEKDIEGSMAGKTIGEVSDRKNFTVVSVYDGERFLFPSDDFTLREGMKMIVVKHNV